MDKSKLFNDLDFYPKGVSYNVPPQGLSQALRIEKVHGKKPMVRAIFADNLPNVMISISKDGADTYVDNIALSVFRSDRPIPLRFPEGDYTVKFVRTDTGNTNTITANIAYII